MVDLEKLNTDRAAEMKSICVTMGFFPVLICAINSQGQMMTFTFTGGDRETMKQMLIDFLAGLDTGYMHVAALHTNNCYDEPGGGAATPIGSS